jgi:hypothetical protein
VAAHVVASTIAKTMTICPQRILVADMMDQGSSVGCPKSKCRIASGARTATAGYDSVGRMQHAVDGLLSEATRKTFTLCEHFAFDRTPSPNE